MAARVNTYRVTIQTGRTNRVLETDAVDSFRAVQRVLSQMRGEIHEDSATRIDCHRWATDIFPLPGNDSIRVRQVQGVLPL